MTLRKEGNDILDPELRVPIVLMDGITVRFPARWKKEHRDAWREVYIRDNWLRNRGKG